MIGKYNLPLPPPDWTLKDLCLSLMVSLVSGKEELKSEIKSLYKNDCILSNLGRTALYKGLKAADLHGKKILMPSIVCPTVIRTMLNAGCRPVLADVEDNLHLSVKTLENAYSEDVKAVLMPHLYGLHCPIEEIRAWTDSRKLLLIDDAAQAVGLTYKGQYLGTFGDMGILSFGPSKSIGISRGGVLMSQNTELIEKADKIISKSESLSDILKRLASCIVKLHYRAYFLAFKELASKHKAQEQETSSGTTVIQTDNQEEYFEISQIEANLIRRVLKRADFIFSKRIETAKKIIDSLDNKIYEPVGSDDIPYVRIPIRLKASASEAVSYLRSLKIEAEQIYKPLHLWEQYQAYADKPLPNAEKLWNTTILVPNPVKEKEIAFLIKSFSDFHHCSFASS